MRYKHTPTTQTRPQAADWRARATALYLAARDRLQTRLQLALQTGLSLYRHIPIITNTSLAAERSVAGVPDLMAGDWRAGSVAAYQQAHSQKIASLGAELALRVHSLTGRSLAPQSIFVDREAEMASAVVDGTVFRLRSGQLVLVRRYAECGDQQFESAPLVRQADLGYALSAWQPQCAERQAEDEANWQDYQTL
jgi:hypothetical protein